MAELFEQFKIHVITSWFKDQRGNILNRTAYHDYCWAPRYRQYYRTLYNVVSICDLFGIQHLENNKEILLENITCLCLPESIQERSYFETRLDVISTTFKTVEEEIRKKLELLDKEEKLRLDEALNCYIEGCNYSTVTMSVSSIEFRLLNLLQSVKPNSNLEKCTLGELISEYLKNKSEYKNIIPKKHEPLLELCNQYRIFSVHPKKERITKQIATSVINLTFAFLLDENLKLKAGV
jgi:hypothetical protein